MIINAIDLDPYECDLLEVGHSTPGFRFMTTYWHDDDPIVYNDRVFRGDAVHLALRFSYDRRTTPPSITSSAYFAKRMRINGILLQ